MDPKITGTRLGGNSENDEAAYQLYRQFDEKVATEAYKQSSGPGFEDTTIVPSEQAKEDAKRVFSQFLTESRSLPASNPVLSLLKEHVIQFIRGRISGIETSYSRPARFIGSLTRIVDYMSRQDSRSAEERLPVVLARIERADDVWSGVRTLLPSSATDAAADVGRACQVLGTVTSKVNADLGRLYPALAGAALSDLSQRLSRLVAKTAQWREETLNVKEVAAARAVSSMETRRAVEPSRSAADAKRQRYKEVLWEELGVNLEDLLDWHEREIAATRAEFLESARKTGLATVDSLTDAFEILNRYGGPCDTVEEMFERMEEYVARAKAGCAEGYVDLPEETCVVRPTPEQTKDDFPWGGYGGGCWRRRPLIGEVFLNETNYKAVSDGWLKMMAIHECYPGHHAQFVRTTTDTLPKTVKIGCRYVPLLEGTAHRSEKMMEHVFAEDPVYPLFVRLRRHHTAIRIKADLYLHYFGRSVDDAVELYMKELGFDRASARGQVRYQERNPGYMTCYYYGMKRLADLQARHAMNDKAFTRELFSVGHLSVDGLEKYLELSEADKACFKSCFGSSS